MYIRALQTRRFHDFFFFFFLFWFLFFRCQQVVDGLEQMPAEMVKTMVVQTIKQLQAAMKNAQSYRESVTAHY